MKPEMHEYTLVAAITYAGHAYEVISQTEMRGAQGIRCSTTYKMCKMKRKV